MKIIITGTSSGIGKAIALKFLAMGHFVIGIDKDDSTIDKKNYTHIKENILTGKLPEINDCEILINNAGVQNENDIDVNLKGTIRITEQYAFQDKIKSVLFIASASAQTGSEFPMYVASKGGMVSYMKNVAMRIAKYNATSNSLSPGGVITKLNEHILSNKELWNQVINETLLKKWADVDEIAEWAYFVTIVNRSMTAQDILIDNGEAAKFNFIW
jgi:hypothetical protein